MQRYLCITGAVCVLWCDVVEARAETAVPTAMRLEYVREPGAERCPDEQAFRDVVEARLTYAPFVSDALARLVVTLKPKGRQVEGRMEIRDSDDVLVWERNMGPLASCQDLVLGMGLSAAIKLRTNARAPPPTAPEPPTPPPQPAPVPVPVSPPLLSVAVKRSAPVECTPEKVEQKNWYKWNAGVGVAFGFGVAPTSPSLGFTAGVGLRLANWSVAVESRWYPSMQSVADIKNYKLTTYRITGTSLNCGHWHKGFGCGLIEFGAQHVENNARVRDPQTKFYGAGGARVGIETDLLPGRLTMRIAGDVLIMPHSLAFKNDVYRLWTTPYVSGTLGIWLFAILN